MELLSPSRSTEKSPLKDVTNSTPTPGHTLVSPRKSTKPRLKRSNSSTTPPQRRSTRLSLLRSDQPVIEENPEEPQTIITTRSRRKNTPSEGSKRTRSTAQEGSVSRRGRKRRSISACPSSPLAEKGSPKGTLVTPTTAIRPRMTRSMSMSAKSEASIAGSSKRDIPVIAEEAAEAFASPLTKYNATQHASPLTANPSPSPFREYPLPISPLKPFNLAPMTTPRVRQTSLFLPSSLKAIHWENNLFAISPGMFPRKAKRMDYLDVLADSDRKEFISPIKPVIARVHVEEEGKEQISTVTEEKVVEPVPVENEALEFNEEEPDIPTQEDHPHLSLLSYLADVASVTDQLPQSLAPPEEVLPYGTIEDILTAAALAESMKEEIFSDPVKSEVDGDCLMEGEDEDVEVDILTVEERSPVKVQAEIPEMSTQSPPSEMEVVEETPSEPATEATLPSAGALPIDEESVIEAAGVQGLSSLVETNGIDHDLDSLISFSEADDTIINQIPDEGGRNSLHPTEEDIASKELNAEEMSGAHDEIPNPSNSFGVDEKGEFVIENIKISEDPPSADEEAVGKDANRLSMDGNVIFKFNFEQEIISSPPKRQISAVSQADNDIGVKKRKTGPIIPNATRLDLLRKRAKRVRSREARHNLKRRDITSALKPVLDNLPSPQPKMSTLRDTPALIPPSLRAKRLQSPVTPAPTKRRAGGGTPLARSPQRHSPVRQTTPSPKKHIVVRPSPVKDMPRGGFEFNFGKKPTEDKENVEPALKPTARFEVYSQIFGPPPQISISLLEKEKDTTTLKLPDPTPTQPLDSEQPRFKSPSRKFESRPPVAKKRPLPSEIATPTVLKRPVRNESFAVPSLPVPPGPPQLPPPSIQRHNAKRFAPVSQPSPAPPSVLKSALPRPTGTFGSALPVPATRRSTRVAKETAVAGKKGISNVSKVGIATQAVPVVLPEKKTLPTASEPVVVEKSVPVPPAPIIPSENITIERPKGKLGGAQRVNPNAKPEPKKVEVATRPTRPPTPPLTSLSQKELKSLTEANTKKNDGYKLVNIQSTVKRVNKKRPGDPSDEFMIGKGAKWSKEAALPEWDRSIPDDGKVRWKSPRFMSKPDRRGALRVKGILKRREKERIDKDEEPTNVQVEPLVIQRFVYKGEKL